MAFRWPRGKAHTRKEEKGLHTQIGKGGEGAPESTPTHANHPGRRTTNQPSPSGTSSEKVPTSFLNHLSTIKSASFPYFPRMGQPLPESGL